MKQTWTTRDFRLQSGDVLPELTLAYEGYGQLAPGGRNADARDPWLHLQPARRRQVRPLRRSGRLVGRPDRTRQGHRHEPLLRHRVQHARLVIWLHGPGQPESQDRSPLRPGVPRHHPARHRDGAEGDAGRARRHAPGRGRRPVVRRLPGLPMGGHVPRRDGRRRWRVVTAPRGQRRSGGGRRARGSAWRPIRRGMAAGTTITAGLSRR